MRAAETASNSSGGFEDPEPVCAPPPWAADLIADARCRAGQEVYPPSDDTFLLLEALAADGPRLRALQPRICLEIGCGTGAVLAGLREVLRGRSSAPEAALGAAATGQTSADSAAAAAPAEDAALFMAVDKNPAAVSCTAALLAARGIQKAAVVQGSLSSSFRLKGLVDICVCNPPYVPGPTEEMSGCGIEVSWAGGERGREVIDILLPEVVGLLAPGAIFYMVCMAENEPEEIMEVMRRLGLVASVAKREQRGIEELSILRFERPR